MIGGRGVLTALLVAAALGLTVLWPGDATWLADEPRLLAEAWHANHDHELARGGLWGNFGVRYGPLPTWIYQALLLITHEPVTLVAIRALLCAGTTAAALLWLARELRLPSWFAAGILAAPHVVQSHRLLWDASFATPLGALTLAAFARLLRGPSGGALVLCAGGASLLPTIHPQALPFALPLLAWLVWRQRPAMRRHWKALLMLAIALLALHARWIVEVVAGLSAAGVRAYPEGASHLTCALAPLLGGNLLGGIGCAAQVRSEVLERAELALGIVYPLVWLGIAVAIRRARETTPRAAFARLALAVLLLQGILFGALRIPAAPQYFFGTFPVHALLAWLAVDELRQLGAVVGAMFGMTAASITLGLALVVHERGRDPALDWPALENQVTIARQLNAFANASAATDVGFCTRHPQALRALRLLLPPDSPPLGSGSLLITRAHSDRAELLLQIGATRTGSIIDITPLPKGWQPAGR